MKRAASLARAGSWTVFLAAGCFGAECHPLEGPWILGRDLAGALPAFSAVEASARIGHAPLAGTPRVFTGRQLRRLAERFAIALGEPGELCFERVSRVLRREEVLAALAAAAGPEGALLELVDFSRRRLPPGELEFPRFPPAAAAAAGRPVIWRGRLRYDGASSVPVWALVRIPSAAPLPAPRRPSGAERLIERRQRVEVEVESGGSRLRLSAVADAGGRLGERVLVRNPATGRRFPAIVTGRGRVKVSIDELP